MAHWFKPLFTSPKSPVLVVVVTRSLGDSLMRLSIRKAMLVAISDYFVWEMARLGTVFNPNFTIACQSVQQFFNNL